MVWAKGRDGGRDPLRWAWIDVVREDGRAIPWSNIINATNFRFTALGIANW